MFWSKLSLSPLTLAHPVLPPETHLYLCSGDRMHHLITQQFFLLSINHVPDTVLNTHRYPFISVYLFFFLFLHGPVK